MKFELQDGYYTIRPRSAVFVQKTLSGRARIDSMFISMDGVKDEYPIKCLYNMRKIDYCALAYSCQIQNLGDLSGGKKRISYNSLKRKCI